MVLGLTSRTDTPPAVMMASSTGRRPRIFTRNALVSSKSLRRWARVTELARVSGGMPARSTITGISSLG